MTGFDGARCVGQHWLFDSIDPRDHRDARDLCATCPALRACAQLLREVQTVSHTMKAAGGGPVGTWAGKLMGVSDRPRRGRYNPREHGTDRGYYQHRWDGTPACAECRVAHSQASRKVAS